ncbi:MAG: hypothetical protein ACE5GL_12250, partial [Calditrichia bacterium]
MKYWFQFLLITVLILSFSGIGLAEDQQGIGNLVDKYFNGEQITQAEKELVSNYLEQQISRTELRSLQAQVNANYPEGTNVVLLGPEPFDTWVPSGWSVTNGNSGNGWGQTTNSNYGGGTNPYAYWDDDAWGSTSDDTTLLASPAFSTVGYSSVTLSFDYGYRTLGGDYSVEVSNDNGATWQTVVTDLPATSSTSSARYPESAGMVVDITAAAGQNANVMVRFAWRDAGGWQWYGALDNV